MDRQRGGIEIIVMLLVILAGFVLVGGSFNFKNSIPQNAGQPVSIKDITPGPGYKNLQIKDLQGSSPAPTPAPTSTPVPSGNACNYDNGQPAQVNNGVPVTDPTCFCPAILVECRNKQCVRILNAKVDCPIVGLWTTPGGNKVYIKDPFCGDPYFTPTDGTFCIGKPVIYLYPTKDTLVNVKLNIPGTITQSIPLYPDGGWKNVLAHPNGSLEYQGKTYSELYYESAVDKISPPQKGLVMEKSKLEQELRTLTSKLGLIDKEQQEFLDYWLPKLKQINYPYVFVSVIEPKEKERIDGVNINPVPDTKIEFLAYFKGLDKKIAVEPLVLPNEPPQRVGFTAVEWGGTIDTGN